MPEQEEPGEEQGQEPGQVWGKPNPTRGGTNPEPSGGQQNTRPTTRSQWQAQQEQGTKRANEDGEESNARKRSRFICMAPKLRKKGCDVTCPAEF